MIRVITKALTWDHHFEQAGLKRCCVAIQIRSYQQ